MVISRKGNWVVGDKDQRDTYCSLYTLLYFLNFEPCAYIPIQKNKKIKTEMQFKKISTRKTRFLTNFKQKSSRAFQTFFLDTDYISNKTF